MNLLQKLNLGVATALLAGCVSGFTSCTSADGPEAGGEEILLSAGVPRVTTNAASGTRAVLADDAEFTAGIAGWQSAGSPAYAAGATWQTRFRAKANPAVADVSLETRQTYHSSSSVKTYMKAWYPDGKLENGTVDFSLCPEYKGDGTLDVLLARELSGSKADRFNKALLFEHVTTQLLFKVKEGEGLAAGTRIEKIEIMNAKVPYALNLTADRVLSNEATLAVPGIDGTVVIGTTPAGDIVGEPVMLETPSGNTLTLRVTTSTAVFENIVITIDDDEYFLSGKAYEITLTFNQREIEIGAAVAEWSPGSGSGTII